MSSPSPTSAANESALAIPGYHLVAKLGEGTQSAIYRGFLNTAPERPLAIKVFRTTPLSDRQVAHYRQKVEHLRVVSDPMLLTPESFEVKSGVPFIVRGYFDGLPLDEWARRQPAVTLDAFFAIACQLAMALDKVHEAGIIHGGVKPHNILVDPATLETRLTGFVTPLDVRDVSHFIFDPAFISGTLAYTSPEQTGRIHHVVVFSSDLYSLGVVFYELLTRRLPFRSTDPLALIHQHLAEEAPPVHEVNPEIPAALSRIVAKLIVKQPEKRYQSGRGLFADLVRCRTEWEVRRSIARFPLATEDRSRRVVFVSKMVGRDSEARAILDAYEQAAQGEFRSVLISGLPGIGKTRLIQELQQPIVRHRGYFTSGKFDIYQKNIPYSSIIQALRNLIRTFLTESQERISARKGRILEVVGQNGRVLIDVIPELESLIDEQPPVAPLPPVEARNRFHNLFDQFLGCLASAESPLTLFIDDLQWCDVASFDFLQTLFTNSDEHPHLFFIGAYRHNEVDSSHPLAKLVAKAKGDKKPLEEIGLRPLEPKHCHEMVSYILDAPLAHTEALATFLADLTEGNPLFVSESLSYLYNEDLLYVDDEIQWRWDLERIRRSNMPSTVVALFSAKIAKLGESTVDLLQTAACMGNTVAPEDLARVSDLALVGVFESLKPALGQGLIIENRGKLQFIHDRVQEAVLTAIAPERRRAIHWRVGHRLLAAVPAGADLDALDNLFAIVSHLNLGRPAELDRAQAWRLADINFHAGEKALNALATAAASELFGKSKELLPPDCWETEYEETFKIFRKAAKTELMCGRSEQSEALLADLLEHARTDLDKAEALSEQTTSLSSIGNFIKAIETANRGLAYFDQALPDDPEEAERRRAALMAEIQAKHPDVWNEILHMPFTEDRKSKVELAFYSELIPDLYMSGLVPQLYLSAVQSTQHSLAGGMDESVIYSFSIMGLQLGEQEQFEQAFRYEDLARELAARYPNTFGATRGINGVVWCNMHSRSRPEEIVELCLRGVQSGKSCGDLYNAGLCYGPLMWNMQVQGADLGAIEEYAHECQKFSERNNLSFSVGLAEAMVAGWIAPNKNGYEPADMDERVARWEKDNHVAAAGSYYAHLALSHYYFGEHEQAAEALAGVSRYLSGLTDNVLKRQWYVFQALNALKLHERRVGAGAPPDAVLAEIAPLVRKVETWARLGPLLRPYLAFLHAERERLTGQFERARVLYLEAIDCAHAEHYVFLEGHLNECLGEMLLASGHGQAGPFFLEALRLYRCCRAERKELRLRDRHPELVEAYAPLVQPPRAPVSEPPPADTYALPELDVGYLMRSALAISAEIEEQALLCRIMRTVVEASGAQRGYLLVADDGHLRVRAESHAGSDRTVMVDDRRLEDTPDMCSAVVRFVYRTGQRLVLADASQEGEFKDNPQVRALGLRSVMCLPVLKRGRLVGVLYLENRLAPAMFTPAGVQTTELLAAQAAISLENARLVEEMKRAEDALARERERLAVTLHSIGDAVIATDTTCRVTMLNRVGEELTGFTQAEASGKPLTEIFRIVNEHTGAPTEDPVRKVLQSGAVMGLANHTALIARDGSRRAIADSAAPIRGPGGETLGVVLVFRDVTESRRAEEELEQSKHLLELIIDASPACISYLDKSYRYRLANRTYQDWFGHDPEAIRGRHAKDVVGEKAWETVRPNLERAMNGETVADEQQIAYPEGRRWVLSTYTPDRTASGEIAGLVAHIMDIGNLMEAEAALRESEQRLAVTLHSIGDAVIATDTESRVVMINHIAEELTGWSQGEAAGKRLAEVFRIVDEETGARAEDPVRRVLESGVIVGLANHTALVSRDGRHLAIADSAAPIRGRANEILGVVLVFRDVTEARKAEQERDATIELLRIVNVSPDAHALIAAVTDFFQEQSGCEAVGVRLEDGCDYPYYETRGFSKEFVLAERRLCEVDDAGNVARDRDGNPVLECMCGNVIRGRCNPEQPFFTARGSFWTNGTTHLLATTTEADRQARTRNRCNAEGYESVALVPLQFGEERLGLIQLNDRRKGLFSPDRVALWERLAGHVAVGLAKFRAEEALRESEGALKDADRRKNDFLAVLSHELRNPLTPIRNSLITLERTAPGGSQAKRAHAIIDRQVGHLSRLVDDLLDVTRITRGKIQIQPERLDLGEVARRSIEDHRQSFVANGIVLDSRLTSEALWLHADPTRIAQVVGNLLGNAAKFTPRGGRVEVALERDGGSAVLRVRDNGEGIEAEVLRNLFQPFSQAKQTLDRSRGGLGLGLALVRSLAELHGGTAEATSQGLGQGAEFTVRLPLEAPVSGQVTAPKEAHRFHPRRLLGIEDNFDAADSLKEALELVGHEVVVAYDGPSGLAVAREFRPEVLLCDIGLPTMDGYEVARAFRADETLRNTLLVALTGYALPEDLQRAEEAGFARHLPKPPSMEAIEKVLDEIQIGAPSSRPSG